MIELNEYQKELAKSNAAMPKPWELRKPGVLSTFPWQCVRNTDTFGASVVAASGHEITTCETDDDAAFIVCAANEYYPRVMNGAYLRGLVARLAQRLQMARLAGFGISEREELLDEARNATREDWP